MITYNCQEVSSVEQQMIQQRISKPVYNTVVCVTDQRRCDRIIRAGRALADISGTGLLVVNVVRPDSQQDTDSMEYLFSVSKQNNAEMALLYSDDVAKALIRFVKENKVANLLTGIPNEGDSVTTKIWKRFTHVTFFVVEQDGSLREVVNPARQAQELCAAGA